MYVESLAYRKLENDAAWKEHYLADFQYTDGSGKYYHMGMLKSLQTAGRQNLAWTAA